MFLNFLIIQTAPGGPVERFIAQINHTKFDGEISNNNFEKNIFNNNANIDSNLKYQGSQGIDSEILIKIEKLYGFDLPLSQRFFLMIKKFINFDFGESFFQDKKITDLILQKLPVSISLGLWTTLLI